MAKNKTIHDLIMFLIPFIIVYTTYKIIQTIKSTKETLTNEIRFINSKLITFDKSKKNLETIEEEIIEEEIIEEETIEEETSDKKQD